MKPFNQWPLFLVPAVVIIMGTVVNASPTSGTISGTIKDNEDRPLVGAVVRIFSDSEQEAILKTITDKNGRFLASNLSPGNYKLKAIASGYKPVEVTQANVTPSRNTIFDLKLEKASSLLTAEQQRDSYKYVLRRNRTIFQLDEQEYVAEKKTFIREAHGFINFTSSKSFSSHPFPINSSNLNFALAQMLNEDVELVIAGQTGLAVNSPQRLDVQASLSHNDDHKVELAIGYGQLPTISPGIKSISRDINQYTIQATDRWRVSGPVVIVYGFDYSHFDGAKQSNHFAPRISLDLQVSPNDQLFAAIYSPDGADIESSTEFETTKVDFKGPVELISLVPQPALENSQRYEVGYSHTFKDRSRIETALFWDKLSNRTIPLVSEDSTEAPQADSNLMLNTISQTGEAKGVRVIFSQPITSNFSTMAGYSFGQGQELSFSTTGQPMVSVGYFHVFTGKVNAQLLSTGTKVSAVVRLASPNALLAIDPFQKQMRMLDPNFSVYLTQTVPMFGFVPGRWEATLDARNLLDLNLGDRQTKVAITQYWRTIRGGFSVRF